MVQSLIEQYQSETPVEHLLVQQVAMGWQRLHRLWAVEAAMGNLAMLQVKRKQQFPTDGEWLCGVTDGLPADLSEFLPPEQLSAKEKLEKQELERQIDAAKVEIMAIPEAQELEKLSGYERN